MTINVVPDGFVVIPDMAAGDLMEATMRDANFKRSFSLFSADFAAWDFYTGNDGIPIVGRGLKFEYSGFFTSGRDNIGPEDVRKHFRQRGYSGHVGAFLQLLRQIHGLWMGNLVTIPEDDAACWRDSSGCLSVPVAQSVTRGEGVLWARGLARWPYFVTYVGFRPIP